MKKLIILLLPIALSSCDNRDVFLQSISTLPELTLNGQTGQISSADSIKYTLKSTKKEVVYKLVVSGNEQEKQVEAKTIGSGTLFLSGTAFEGERNLSNGTYLIKFTPNGTGKTLINFVLTDNFKNKKEINTEVVTFENLLPVAQLSVDKISVIDAREYLLDASSSYDRDGNYGGFITTYTFKIGTKSIVTDQPKIKWIFGSAGNYELGITIKDSDGGTSSFSKIYSIQ